MAAINGRRAPPLWGGHVMAAAPARLTEREGDEKAAGQCLPVPNHAGLCRADPIRALPRHAMPGCNNMCQTVLGCVNPC